MTFPDGMRAWLLSFVLVGPTSALAAERVEVPLNQRVLSDGTARYFVDMSVAGSRPLAAMVDTGSTGLRILPNVIADAAFASVTDQPSVYGYGSGVRLNGVVATLGVGLGHLAGNVPVQLVRTVDCFPKQPHCPASRISQDAYRIGGDGLANEGFSAILGISMGAGPVDNPLRRLGAQTWIVVLPRPGEKSPGALILNPDAGELADYTLFPTAARLKNLPGGAAAHDAIPGCLVIEKNGKRICGPTLLDTGAPGIHISTGNPAERGGWTKGDQFAVVFTNQQGREVQANFRAGAGGPSRLSVSAPEDASQTDTQISVGTVPYFLLSVWYDDQRHLVGLRRR